jgi:general stress protein 26
VHAERHQHLYEMIRAFKTAMLVTQATSGPLAARPLAIAGLGAHGEIYFATSSGSPKIADIQADANVLLTMQSDTRFVCVSGRARVIHDRTLIRQLWSEAWRLWYPTGLDDPCLCLLAVEPLEGEFWDDAGSEGLKALLAATKAYLCGERLATEDAHAHAKVDLRRGRHEPSITADKER